jgi:DNA (cytosine-5)-methyltransferase 1
MTEITTSHCLPEIRAIDLFCGVGGLTHGLMRGGIKVVAGIDVDTSCRFAYEANNRAEFVEADVSAIDPAMLNEGFAGAPFSLLAGCAPCQPFSTYSQGDRARKEQKDWELVAAFGRLVEKAQPDFVTMENVPSLARHQVFERFLSCLDGYGVVWGTVECERIGIPQTRKRFVLLASRFGTDGLSLPAATADTPTVRKTIHSLPALRSGEASSSDPLHSACKLSETNLKRIRASRPGGTWRDWPDDLRAACHAKSTGSTYPSVYGRMEWDEPAPTITTQCFGYGNGRFGHPEQDRAITLREAAMLQTFPAEYAFLPPGAKVNFSKLGRLIGNAVPVRLGEAIAESFLNHIAALRSPTGG